MADYRTRKEQRDAYLAGVRQAMTQASVRILAGPYAGRTGVIYQRDAATSLVNIGGQLVRIPNEALGAPAGGGAAREGMYRVKGGAVRRNVSQYRALMAESAQLGPVRSSHDVFRVMTLPSIAADGLDQENAWCLNLDVHAYLRSLVLVARGARDHVDLDLADAYRAAILDGCRYIVIVHNHPSGYASPSDADARLTHDAGRGAMECDLVLLDHVIIGVDQYYSFRDRLPGARAPGVLWKFQRGRWAA